MSEQNPQEWGERRRRREEERRRLAAAAGASVDALTGPTPAVPASPGTDAGRPLTRREI